MLPSAAPPIAMLRAPTGSLSSGAPPVPRRSSEPAQAVPTSIRRAAAIPKMFRVFIAKFSLWLQGPIVMSRGLEVVEALLLHENRHLAHVTPDTWRIDVEDVDPATHRQTAVGLQIPGELR